MNRLIATTANRVRLIDRYKDSKTGTHYVLAKLDLQDFKEVLSNSKELRAELRDFVHDNAERVCYELPKRQPDNKTSRPASGGDRQRCSISTKVQGKLTEDRTMNFSRFEVDTVRGVVVLSGVFENLQPKARAFEIARQIDGVKAVNNNLQVQSRSTAQ
ncbi:MAG: uncharacterized protein K0S45_3436 [Nitrospira sp.]|jgi:hypothetical protein|nr:uncharacterized protein [Nitrospira sp.]